MASKISTFPNLQFRNLRMLTDSENQEVHEELKLQMSLIGKKSGPQNKEATPPAAKKLKSDFLEWCDFSGDVDVESEIQLYINSPCVRDETGDILSWWKQHETDFPNLAELAKKYLNIPASSASSERNFSAAGLVISERRTRLSTENVDSILFLHDNLFKK